MKAISPEQAKLQAQNSIPDFVLEGFNNTIVKNLRQGRAFFKQSEVVAAILATPAAQADRVSSQTLFANHWLDVEPLYRAQGWKVDYDKPAYCESYEANFTFIAP